jgi:phosphopentomutase
MINRVIWIVLDSLGCGALPDAERFGDVGSNTLCNTVKATQIVPQNLKKLGLFNINGIDCLPNEAYPDGNYGKCIEISEGKDTTVGHWEMTGVSSTNPLPTYPNGFPKEIMEEFERLTERKAIANKTSSGTGILEELGEHHVLTGDLIVYTSADSVFQIAAHEEVVPIDELYRYCEIARRILQDEHAVARVIARPFIGKQGDYTRTSNRRDYSLSPPKATVLDHIKEANLDVIGIGKIEDIFNNVGITEALHTHDNMDGVDQTLNYMKQDNKGLIFTNLVEFDSSWGHRNNVEGYGQGIMDFDNRLPEILENMLDSDVLIINADHGCDPTMPGTDHSREYIPLIAYGKELKKGVNLGVRSTFADIGKTVADLLKVRPIEEGISFKSEIIKG